MTDIRPAEKTRSITFRMPVSLIDELQAEADQNEIGLNVSVNQILRRHVSWDRYMNVLGMIQVPRVMLSVLLDRAIAMVREKGYDVDGYREEIVHSAAQIAFLLMRDSVLLMKKNYDLWSVLDMLHEYMRSSGMTSDHTDIGGVQTFLVQHDLGENWSLFVKELLSLIFANLAGAPAEFDVTPKTVVARVTLDRPKTRIKA